jgi:hypothetical protein
MVAHLIQLPWCPVAHPGIYFLDHSIKKGKENMKHLFRSRMIRLPGPRYRAPLVALVVVATLVMILTSATAYASAPRTPTLTGSAVSRTAIPYSAHGCNQSVCIWVCNNSSCTGSGLYIDHVIGTGVSTSRNGCVVGQMLVRGSVRLQTNQVCWLNPPGHDEYLYAYYHVGYNINNGSQVCVRFKGLGAPKGEPCETVHS